LKKLWAGNDLVYELSEIDNRRFAAAVDPEPAFAAQRDLGPDDAQEDRVLAGMVQPGHREHRELDV
jgi:hypothetical protein